MRKDYIVGVVIIAAAVAAAGAWLVRVSRETALLAALPNLPAAHLPAFEPPMKRSAMVATQPAIAAESPQRTQMVTPSVPNRPPKSPSPQQNAKVSRPLTAANARESLARVGMDDEAGEFWYSAINSPDLSASERKNLIEDLNETGFADPKNLTANDLPLIESRIAILEQLGPETSDEINVAAMQEAYKDLLNMRSRLTGE